MSAPTVTAVLDKAAYTPGEGVTLTVSYADADAKVSTITVTGTDAEGNPATVTINLNVADPVTLTVSDDAGHAWVKGADNGSTAVFTTTA